MPQGHPQQEHIHLPGAPAAGETDLGGETDLFSVFLVLERKTFVYHQGAAALPLLEGVHCWPVDGEDVVSQTKYFLKHERCNRLSALELLMVLACGPTPTKCFNRTLLCVFGI